MAKFLPKYLSVGAPQLRRKLPRLVKKLLHQRQGDTRGGGGGGGGVGGGGRAFAVAGKTTAASQMRNAATAGVELVSWASGLSAGPAVGSGGRKASRK